MSIGGEENNLLLNPSLEAHLCIKKVINGKAMTFGLFEKYFCSGQEKNDFLM